MTVSEGSSLTIDYFMPRCEDMARQVVQLDYATATDVAAMRPGGEGNADLSVNGWLAYLLALTRWHARGTASFAAQVRAATQAAADDANAAAINEHALLDAIRESPVTLTLTFPKDDGAPRAVAVRPLSYEALAYLDGVDRAMQLLCGHLATLTPASDAGDLQVYLDAMAEVSRLHCVAFWIVTSETAPQLPFDPATDRTPVAPAWVGQQDPLDFIRVMHAHANVNKMRLSTLSLLALGGEGQKSAGWATFFSILEGRTDGQTPAATFIKNRSLAALLASTALSNHAERTALEAAKRKAEASGQRGH